MPKLYELSAAYQSIQALMENDDDNNDWSQALESLTDDITTKAENIAGLIRELQADAEAFKAEARRMAYKLASAESHAERLKDYLKAQLEAMGLDRVKGQLFTVALQASPPSCTVVDEAAVDLRFQTLIPQHYEVNRRSIIEAWKQGEEIDGASVTTGRHLRIR